MGHKDSHPCSALCISFVVLCRTYTEVEENNVTAARGRHRAALDPPHPARRQRPPALRRAVPGLCLSILHDCTLSQYCLWRAVRWGARG
jgi:hypothetical protein